MRIVYVYYACICINKVNLTFRFFSLISCFDEPIYLPYPPLYAMTFNEPHSLNECVKYLPTN